jgi:hypothetical protein
MRPDNRILVNKDSLAEPNARHWQGLEAWRTGIQHVSLPLRRPSVRGIVHLWARQVLGIDLKCSESVAASLRLEAGLHCAISIRLCRLGGRSVELGPFVTFPLHPPGSRRRSGHSKTAAQARSGLMHRGKEHPHSITSSARASSVSGTVRPRVLAVFMLITSSYFVGACTGRFAGFSPFKMRST